ncbi:hypothetical protein FN846DRAFT_1000617 [Sphaerosporella brunnea]|uniref:Uncharacterized protein n=1 Tax=Sphaerosporella brunnea TaxID=1250544 RepID=A0A5J5EI69_9PEZI|nr:hypothetical protein FN846DRAFT_1000617 [Sphaerosporella brunnea]
MQQAPVHREPLQFQFCGGAIDLPGAWCSDPPHPFLRAPHPLQSPNSRSLTSQPTTLNNPTHLPPIAPLDANPTAVWEPSLPPPTFLRYPLCFDLPSFLQHLILPEKTMTTLPPNRPPQFGNHQPFLPNGSVTTGMPQPLGAAGLPPNTTLTTKTGARVLCIADVRGHLRTLNELAKKANADYILHTGDFGFYDDSSLDRIADKTLRHVAQYSPLLDDALKKQMQAPGHTIKALVQQVPHPLSELSLFLNGTYTLDVPVYTVWGACEDVRVLEKFRSGEYKIRNLHIIDEASSRLLDVGGVKLRLLGLGGAVVMHKLFDNGEGRTTIAGGQGTMWTTLLQMGELVDTANRVYDPTETRIFLTHNSPAREGLLNQLSVTLKADFSISAGLHFRYGSSYNEFSVNPSLDHYRGKLASSKASFNDVWETVKGEVSPAVKQNPSQHQLLENALSFIDKMPTSANGGNPFGGSMANAPGAGQVDESAFKNMWNFNLADAAFGWLILEVENGRIGTEMKAQGFNFSHRGGKHSHPPPVQPAPIPAAVPQPAAQAVVVSPAVSPAVPLGPRNKPPQAPTKSTSPPPAVPSPRIETAVPTKPATPHPAPTTPAAPEPTSPVEAKASNGTGTAAEEAPMAAESPVPAAPSVPGTPVADNRPLRTGLHVSGAASVEAVRELFPEEDRKYITFIEEKTAKTTRRVYHLVLTETEELAKEVLSRLPSDLTSASYDHDKIHIKLLDSTMGMFGGDRRGDRGSRGMESSKWSRGGNFGGNTSESDAGSSYKRGGFNRGKLSSRGFEGGRGGRGGRGRGGRVGRFDGDGGASGQTD